MTGAPLTGFSPATRQDWLRRVNAVLKGGDFEKSLVSLTGDGICIEPLYGQEAGPRAARGAAAPWIVQARVDHPDAAKANAQALDDLTHGATGLTLVCEGAPTARGFGMAVKDFPRALADVQLHAIALRVEAMAMLQAPWRGSSQVSLLIQNASMSVSACPKPRW